MEDSYVANNRCPKTVLRVKTKNVHEKFNKQLFGQMVYGACAKMFTS